MSLGSRDVTTGFACWAPSSGTTFTSKVFPHGADLVVAASFGKSAIASAAPGQASVGMVAIVVATSAALASGHLRAGRRVHKRRSKMTARRQSDEVPKLQPMRPDLFLQFACGNGVLLSGVLSGNARFPQLPAAGTQFSIVPVGGGSTACIPYEAGVDDAASEKLKRRLSPGPMRPKSVAGRALQHILRTKPNRFPLLKDYELLRRGLDSSDNSEESGEILLLAAYWNLLKFGGAPARPSALDTKDFSAYAMTFGSAAMKALQLTTSPDFQLLARAHVLGLAQNASFPQVKAEDARSMYSNAVHFGHALRQAELRFQADGLAGTFVPVALETQLQREELERSWAGGGSINGMCVSGLVPIGKRSENVDANDAQKSLTEVSTKLERIGEAQPGLVTYLGWLGQYDPDALSLLASPSPSVTHAIRRQLDALWGDVASNKVLSARLVATTPSDLVEAVLVGAWLCDASIEAENAVNRHRHADADWDSL